MGSSVVGRFLTRTKETTRVDSNLLIVLAGLIAAAIVSERLPVTASLWAIPSAIIANWIVLSAHESFSRFVEGVEIEPMSTLRYGKVQSAPRFDPSRGYVVDVSYNGHVIPVILDFTTTTALSVPQRVNPGVSMEASRGGLPPTSVKLEDVPPSVVVLYHDSVRLGLGTRVRTPTGRDLLMTNHHIAALEPNGIAYKGHLKKVALDAPVIACDHPHIDCAFYEVPPKIWSLLGVKSASLKPLVKQTAVSLFGGSSSTDFSSCVGIAQIGDNPFLIRHQSTTCSGWSGSPLYHKGCVVGLHIGAADGFNVASNVAWYFHTFKKEVVVESPFEIYGKFREANSEEYDESLKHGVEYAEYDFSGDTIRASSNTWVRERERYHAEERRKSGQPSWADRFGDDSGEDVDIETSHPVAPSISRTRRKRSKRVEQFVDAVSECSFSFESAHEGITPETSAYDHVPLNLPGGGLEPSGESALGRLIQLGEYRWDSLGDSLPSDGMPFSYVGKSGVIFGEHAGKSVCAAVKDAISVFPDLEGFGWPERGSKAELDSLILQAGRFNRTVCPPGLAQAVQSLQERYPKVPPRRCLRDEWRFDDIFDEVERILCETGEVNSASSPGVPLAGLANSNGEVRGLARDLVCLAVVERLNALASVDPRQHNWTPRELVEKGLCDPVRLFVKNEPHPRKKLLERRFRLISSVSLVDQLVERMLFGPQNNTEISTWWQWPSKPGMGLLTPEQIRLVWDDVFQKHQAHPAAEADISGFDWSVQDWELWSDLAIRINRGNFQGNLRRAAISRYYCFMNSVFQLSDGTLIQQELPGLMKSGSYCTSSTNSRIRCLMAELIGSPWCIAMGDDSVEGWIEGAQSKYAALGHTCKEYYPCKTRGRELLEFNFCSHLIRRGHAELTSWPKALFRFLSSKHEDFEDLWVELHTCGVWGRIERYLRGIGRVSHKDGQEGQENQLQPGAARKEEEPTSTWAFGGTPASTGSSGSGLPDIWDGSWSTIF
nr:polyprotein [Rice yellow mottle virus]